MAVVDDKVGVDVLCCNLVDAAAVGGAVRGELRSLEEEEEGSEGGDAPAVGRVCEDVELLVLRQAAAQGAVDGDGVVELLVGELERDLEGGGSARAGGRGGAG